MSLQPSPPAGPVRILLGVLVISALYAAAFYVLVIVPMGPITPDLGSDTSITIPLPTIRVERVSECAP